MGGGSHCWGGGGWGQLTTNTTVCGWSSPAHPTRRVTCTYFCVLWSTSRGGPVRISGHQVPGGGDTAEYSSSFLHQPCCWVLLPYCTGLLLWQWPGRYARFVPYTLLLGGGIKPWERAFGFASRLTWASPSCPWWANKNLNSWESRLNAFQACFLTLFYTPYGWITMRWLWKITQQNFVK
jgi:hypothetical protein